MAKPFVLVHGAWHGGWCWRRIADILAAQGCRVFTPTLSGVADRAHLPAAGISLATQIDDVVNLIRFEELRDVILVGHSYGGFVVSGAAEAIGDRLAGLVMLDAFVPEDGQAMIDVVAPASGAAIHAAGAAGEVAVKPIPAANFRVNAADSARVDALCTPHPIRCFLDPIRLTGARERVARKAYIRATGYPSVPFDAARDRLAGNPGWSIHGIPCGHDVMLDAPEQLARTLIEIARS